MILAENYALAKQMLAERTGMSEALLHLHIGLAIFVAAALALRRRMRSAWPILAVTFFAIGNEIVDRISHGSWRLLNSVGDVANTLFWPAVLFLLAKRGKGASNIVDR